MFKRIKLLIKLTIKNFIYFISYFTPKNKRLWIFGAWHGKKYSDNPKYLFEYVNKEHPEIDAVWLTKNKKVLELVRKMGYEAYLIKSLKGILISMRASVFIISSTKYVDLGGLGSRAKIIQLWHGTPLKKIESDISTNHKKNHLFDRFRGFIKFIFPFFSENYSIIITASEETQKKMASAFNTKFKKIKITGYPRSDVLFETSKFKKKGLKCIYMPTFRDNSNFNPFKFNFDANEIDTYLKNRNMELYIKLHPNDNYYSYLKGEINYSRNIHIFSHDDVYEYLNQFDFLITDYSSIYFDYLLLNKPIIFAPFDIDTYLNEDRTFYYDYDEVTPGPKAKDWLEIIDYIDKSIQNPKEYEDSRKRINGIFNKYSDKNNSQRVFNEIIKVLER